MLDEAVRWQSCMLSGDVTDQQVADCEAWRLENPSHELIWQRLQEIDAQFADQPQNARQIIHSARGYSRRNMLKALLFAAIGTPMLYGGLKFSRRQGHFSDLAAGLGEYKRVRLPDGSVLHLNTSTHLDIVFNENERRIILHEGEILIDSAPDTFASKRDLIVESPLAEVKALGTRFIVKSAGPAGVSVFSGAVLVSHKKTRQQRVLEKGFKADLLPDGIGLIEKVDPSQESWKERRLVVDGVALSELVDDINRYFPGYIFYSEQVQSLRISGVFPLDDKAAILEALQNSLPVSVEQRTRYWTLITSSK